MVAWSDFLAASPWTEFWHFGIGLGAMVLVVYLFRANLLWGTLGAVAFVSLVAFKEFWLDLVLEGATINGGAVDATFFYLGGIAGAVTGLVSRPTWQVLLAVGSLMLVGVLLGAGVV